jgi:hypothetical protein
MDLASFHLLLEPPGQETLRLAEELEPRESDFLRGFTALSCHFPAGLVRAALETAILRREAAAKFPFSGRMYFTREALEQASSYAVSSYRAERFKPFQILGDFGCSIGGDTLALAQTAPTIALDLDPLRISMAQANLRALGFSGKTLLLQADLNDPAPLSPASLPARSFAIFFDPARRSAGRRIFSVRDYRPRLESVKGWLPRFPALGVKISPGVDLSELEGYNAEVEFISLRGELKEAVLWFGPLQTTQRRATLLPGRQTLSTEDLPARRLPLSKPQDYLYEPDPAVLRAGLVAAAGASLDAAQLDPEIAYLTAGQKIPTPFARVWAVEDWFPFSLKRLRAYLRERDAGQVVVKKRGSPLEPETLIHDLR